MRKKIKELVVKVGLSIGFITGIVLLFIIIKTIFFT